jgi:predicted RecB family nuclease
MNLGREHERRHLERFPEACDLGGLAIAERVERTREEVAAGERVVYQGALRAEVHLADTQAEIVGVPDFLLPARRGYAIRDSKLAHRVDGHPEIGLQLALYGWLYEQTFDQPPVAVQAHTGLGTIEEVPYEGGAAALATLEEIIRLRSREDPPHEVVGWSKCSGCGYFDRCWPEAMEQRSIGLLPWVDRGLIGELDSRGVQTIEDLLSRYDAGSLAELERPWGRRRKKVGPTAERILASARALAEKQPIVLQAPAIPESTNCVMFDLEGLPSRLDELEKIYLWGLQVFGERPSTFRPATAGFGPEGDGEGWEAFLNESEAVFTEYGDIPFVHWATYERAKIDLYLGRYGDRDGIAARVKENLLDLLPITYDAVALPTSSYSLKQIETFAGFERRLTGAGGDWSMARYIEATETNDERLRASIMDEILAYNREDLEATWAVLEWLARLEGNQPPSGP